MINEKRLLDTFLEYVQIDSETKNEKAMGERLVQDLKALGFEVQTDRAGEAFGSNGFNVHAFLEGTIPGDPTIFCAHMDTVAPGNGIRPVIKDGIIGTDGSTILRPLWRPWLLLRKRICPTEVQTSSLPSEKRAG